LFLRYQPRYFSFNCYLICFLIVNYLHALPSAGLSLSSCAPCYGYTCIARPYTTTRL
jgi:hypothetical protein